MSVLKILISFTVGYCLSASAQNTYLHVANYHGSTVSSFSLDPVTGTLTSVGPAVATGLNPNVISTDRSCRVLYAPSPSSNNISAFSIGPNTGVLTPILGSPFLAGNTPLSATVDGSGSFTYVPNYSDSTISAYRIDSNTGALSPIAGSPFAAAASPQHAIVDPSRRFLFVANDSGSVSGFAINSVSGALTEIAGSPWPTGSLSRSVRSDINGRFLYVSNTASGNISIFSIDQTTGALTPVSGSPVSVEFNVYEVQIEPHNKYAYAGVNGGNLYGFSIDSTTGMLTPLAGFPRGLGGDRGRMGIDPTGKFLYSSTNAGDKVDAFQIDPASGNLAYLASYPAGNYPNSFAICSTQPYSAAIQQPVNSDGSSVFSANRGVVPVKFTLTLNGQPTCTLPAATITLQRTTGTNIGNIDESIYVAPSDTGSQFRVEGCQYVYNLSTSSLGTGSYSVGIAINGSRTGSAKFGLK
jgi:6-phosphogluconolactonase